MEDLYCKDCSLEETIENARKALDREGISVKESFMQGAEGAFSVRLELKDVAFGTNGKGVTKEAALASAYGEFMERIQQFALYKLAYPVNDMYDYPFCYYPDEVEVPIERLREYCSVFQKAYCADTPEQQKLLSLKEREKNVFYALKYRNLLNNEEVQVPAKMAEYIYGTNGMAAGNTLDEALVQGLSELFERYANKLICLKSIVPPLIPDDKLRLSEKAKLILEKLKEKNYEIQFRDCSMGIGLPVVGMIFIDKSGGKYYVKFGAHPIMEVAVERTLTELFQGRKLLGAAAWMQSFGFEELENPQHTFETIFRDGNGKYPYEIFGKQGSYPFDDCWYKGDFHDNKELLQYCKEIVERNNWTVYFKEFHFLELFSVHIFIPEISYLRAFDNSYVERLCLYKNVCRNVRNISECDNKQKEEIIRFLENNYYGPGDSIALLYTLPLDADTELLNCKAGFFKYLLYATMDENEKALAALDRFIQDNGMKNHIRGAYYRCLRAVFYAVRIRGISPKEAFETVSAVFEKEIVDAVMEDAFNQEGYLKKFTYACKDAEHCKRCGIHDECRYPRIIDMHKKLAGICLKKWEKNYEQVG